MAEQKRTKAEIESEIRNYGITLINTEDMTKVGNGTFYLYHAESDRYIEFKIIVKSEKFDQEELDGLIEERRIIDEGKAARAAAAAAKRAKDNEKRKNKENTEEREVIDEGKDMMGPLWLPSDDEKSKNKENTEERKVIGERKGMMTGAAMVAAMLDRIYDDEKRENKENTGA